jgi:hypothetical protein
MHLGQLLPHLFRPLLQRVHCLPARHGDAPLCVCCLASEPCSIADGASLFITRLLTPHTSPRKLTNVPLRSAPDAQTVYTDWRYRPQIEHSDRFEQEDGLDVEDLRVRQLERMRHRFLLVLLPPSSSTTSATPGPRQPSADCAAWEVNSASLLTATTPPSSSPAFAPSSPPLLPSPSPPTTPSPVEK